MTNDKKVEASARAYVAGVVSKMVEAGYPVEATNKADHRPDFLPVEHFGWSSAPAIGDE